MVAHITKQNKEWLSQYGDGSYDSIVNKLIDDVEDRMPVLPPNDSPTSTMRLKQDTIDRLQAYAILNGESLESIIVRMLIMAHDE